jgi:hypothetical protein
MARALAKVKTHAGGGAGNAAYIGRPQEERSRETEPRPGEEPIAARSERLAEMREGDARPARGRAAERGDDDPVWGWNLPSFVTGEAHGIWETEEGRALLESRALALSAHHLGLGSALPSSAKLSVEEKRENLVAHFSAMADLEERQRGLSHFRIILSVGPEVSISELKAMVNAFLRANFPLCPAFVAIHDDTEHRHAHLYVHARQLDNRRVDLGQDYFRLDESWMEICAKHLGSPEIYDRHVELKEETREWRERAEKARDAGKPLPPKPDRWGDHHDTLLFFRPFDDRWCGRLLAQARVAEKRVTWLEATKARPESIAVSREEARNLRERLDEAADKRAKSRRETKRGMPAEVVTLSEARDLLLYERDILKAGKSKGRGDRPKQSAAELMRAQGALLFDTLAAERGGQPGFDFMTPAAPSKGADRTLPDAGVGKMPPARARAKAETPPVNAASTSASWSEAARSFGRELVAEVKLVHTESGLSAGRSVKERGRLKEQLMEDRREHARARDEAAQYRSLLTAWGVAEPPYLLKEDERSYLVFMSGRVPERLRERVKTEVSRAVITTGREEETPARLAHEPAPPAEASGTVRSKVGPSLPAAVERPGDNNPDTKRDGPALEDLPSVDTAPARQAEITRADARTLPDDEVRLLTVRYELAKARAGALRAAETDFNAAPHHWVSPRHGVSLAGVEEKIAHGLEGNMNVGRLREAREQVRDELATERVQSPLRRRSAEDEARSLEAHLRHETAARAKLDLEMPDVVPPPEVLRELVACAETSRDARLLRRIFEVERDRALRGAGEGGHENPVRLLEERYAGIELMADVRADRSRVVLARMRKESDKTVLPAVEETGRDTVATLDQVGARKGIRGALGKLVEPGWRRLLRERLLETKDAYFGHLRADAEGREAFHKAALEMVRECRELSREFGYHTRAVPELSPEQIREARDHAVTRSGTEREGWLTACTQSQKLKDERKHAFAEAGRAERSVDIILPGTPAGEDRAELIRGELEAHRERASRAERERTTKSLTDRDQPGVPDKSLPEPDRGGGGYRGGR